LERIANGHDGYRRSGCCSSRPVAADLVALFLPLQLQQFFDHLVGVYLEFVIEVVLDLSLELGFLAGDAKVTLV